MPIRSNPKEQGTVVSKQEPWKGLGTFPELLTFYSVGSPNAELWTSAELAQDQYRISTGLVQD